MILSGKAIPSATASWIFLAVAANHGPGSISERGRVPIHSATLGQAARTLISLEDPLLMPRAYGIANLCMAQPCCFRQRHSNPRVLRALHAVDEDLPTSSLRPENMPRSAESMVATATLQPAKGMRKEKQDLLDGRWQLLG